MLPWLKQRLAEADYTAGAVNLVIAVLLIGGAAAVVDKTAGSVAESAALPPAIPPTEVEVDGSPSDLPELPPADEGPGDDRKGSDDGSKEKDHDRHGSDDDDEWDDDEWDDEEDDD